MNCVLGVLLCPNFHLSFIFRNRPKLGLKINIIPFLQQKSTVAKWFYLFMQAKRSHPFIRLPSQDKQEVAAGDSSLDRPAEEEAELREPPQVQPPGAQGRGVAACQALLRTHPG